MGCRRIRVPAALFWNYELLQFSTAPSGSNLVAMALYFRLFLVCTKWRLYVLQVFCRSFFFFFFSAHRCRKVWYVRSCWCTYTVIAQRRLQASSKSLSVMLECYKYLSGMLFARIFTFRHKYHICGSSTVTCACNFSRQSVSVQFSDSERFHLSLVKVTTPCSSCRHSTQVNFRL